MPVGTTYVLHLTSSSTTRNKSNVIIKLFQPIPAWWLRCFIMVIIYTEWRAAGRAAPPHHIILRSCFSYILLLALCLLPWLAELLFPTALLANDVVERGWWRRGRCLFIKKKNKQGRRDQRRIKVGIVKVKNELGNEVIIASVTALYCISHINPINYYYHAFMTQDG